MRLKEKKIRIFKKQYEKDLPEIATHDEPLRYLFSTVLQYAISSSRRNGSIGFLTKTIEPKGTGRRTQPTQEGLEACGDSFLLLLSARERQAVGEDPGETCGEKRRDEWLLSQTRRGEPFERIEEP